MCLTGDRSSRHNRYGESLWLIKKSSIKSSRDKSGNRVYELPIILFMDADRPADHWDPYASRQRVNYVKGKHIEKLTQPYSKRQYDRIKKMAITVSDSEGNAYYMFSAQSMPLLRGKMTKKEYHDKLRKMGYMGDPPVVLKILDFPYEMYPDGYPVVYTATSMDVGGNRCGRDVSYMKIPRERKLTTKDVCMHNRDTSSTPFADGKKEWYIKRFHDSSGENFIFDNPRVDVQYGFNPQDLNVDMVTLPSEITALMKSIRPKHLEHIEERRAKKDSSYIPKKVFTKDNMVEPEGYDPHKDNSDSGELEELPFEI